jgi:hypothetical protein
MTGTNCDLFTQKSSRSYLNHLVKTFQASFSIIATDCLFQSARQSLLVSIAVRQVVKVQYQCLKYEYASQLRSRYRGDLKESEGS